MTRAAVLVAAMIAVIATVCATAVPGAGAPPTDATRRLDRAWDRIEARPADLSAPELLDFVLDAAASGAAAPPARIETALELAEALQDRDPNSLGFGNFRWYRQADKVRDYSAVEFVMQRAAMVRLRYDTSLSADARKRLDRLIRFGIQGIRRHRVAPAHTNVYLMKASNCLLIGEATSQPSLAAEGSRMLDAWLMSTYEHGLEEFLSPAYYGVDVVSLGLIAQYAKDPAAKAKAQTALKFFWTDIAANWFEPGLRLGGARSRDFDRLTGHGYLDEILARLGWIPTDPQPAGSALLTLSTWEPPASLTRPILANLPRTVCRRWGPGNGAACVTYVGKGVCVGTSGAGVGPTDKVLTVDLGGGPARPLASFLMDGRGDPYGRNPRVSGGGHRKTSHLAPFVATVQRGPEALLLASADTADKENFRHTPTPNCLLSHLILPQADEIWIANRKVDLDQRGDAVAVFPGEPLFVRLGKAALAVRVLLALDTAGNPAAVALFADGAKVGAMRLTVTHSPDAPKGRGTVGLWVRAADGIDNAGDFADFRKHFGALGSGTFSDGRVELGAPGLEGKLRIFADVWKQRAIELDGGDRCPPGCVLAIDGRDRGKRLLQDTDIVSRYLSLLRAKSPGRAAAGQVIQAESADLIVPPFVIANNSDASAGRFVWVPKSAAAGSTDPARVLCTVNVPTDGMYALSARVWTTAGPGKPFAVRIRQRGRDVLKRTDFPTGAGSRWRWVRLSDKPDGGVRRFRLHAGPAVVEVLGLSPGAGLDAVRLEHVRTR